MNLKEIYDRLKAKKHERVVLQFTNEYLDQAKQIERDFSAALPGVKFFIAADK